MIKKIFISRNLGEDSCLKESLTTSGFEVIDKSLIKISEIRYTHTPKCDWIFFSSQNAIKFFFVQNPVINFKVRYAVFGKSSANMLERYGKKADFIGTGNDSLAIARQFIAKVDGDIILFPQALDSAQTIQRWLPFNNISRNLFVYKTTPLTDFILPECDLLVFTSPSNVNVYFSKYSYNVQQTVIAIGTTTQLALKSKGIREVHLPVSFDEESLLDKIIKIIELEFC